MSPPEGESIGIRELHQHASRYVAMAKTGKRVPVTISAAVVDAAGRLPDPLLGSLGAIHLATALLVREGLDVLLSYD